MEGEKGEGGEMSFAIPSIHSGSLGRDENHCQKKREEEEEEEPPSPKSVPLFPPQLFLCVCAIQK